MEIIGTAKPCPGEDIDRTGTESRMIMDIERQPMTEMEIEEEPEFEE